MFGVRVPQLMQVVRCRCLRLAPSPSLSLPRRFHEATTEPDTHYHQIDGQISGRQREIAYKKSDGPQKLGLIYIPGFMAHKGGGKALALHTFAQKNGFPYVRYDPSGMGESKGVHRIETRFSMWLEDASEILQNVTEGPQIIVSSSMGSWITCLLASKYPEKLLGVVMLAPAINFHTRYEKVLRSQLPPEALKLYEEGGVVKLYAPDYGEFPLSKAQFGEMKKYTLPLQEDQVAVTCPTRVIHGMKDKDVPHTESLALVNSLKSQDVELNYLKQSGHTLLDDVSLQVIYDTILRLNHHLLHSQAKQ